MTDQIKALEDKRDELIARMSALENTEGSTDIEEALLQIEYEDAEDKVAVITVKLEKLKAA